ncbi:MAG TPA: NAD(P)H-dependent oxidoreductase [Bacteroidia bacterium]|nr:NAD(P)H-dependent oxidoreductase [Bacteroidia bacterium]
MITVISGTNKKNSLTRQVAAIYTKHLQAAGNEVKQLLLEELDYSFISAEMFSKRPQYITRLQEDYFNSASFFVFVVPEYNGSFPGILKVLLDTFDVKPAFENKKAALVGVATGRAGNLRGLDHLTSILQHMHVTVIPGHVLISRAKEELDANGNLIHESTLNTVTRHIGKITGA